jgi:predicted RNA-binding protein with PUA-like domain
MSAARRTTGGTGPTHVRYWVFLADPADYGWDDLVADGETRWDGIRNAQARRHLQSCRQGDVLLVYHTAPDKALVGTARVVEAGGDDGADGGVAIAAITPLQRRLGLAEIREDAVLSAASFVRMPRVAVHPLSEQEWDRIMMLSGTDPGTAGNVDPAGAGGP